MIAPVPGALFTLSSRRLRSSSLGVPSALLTRVASQNVHKNSTMSQVFQIFAEAVAAGSTASGKLLLEKLSDACKPVPNQPAPGAAGKRFTRRPTSTVHAIFNGATADTRLYKESLADVLRFSAGNIAEVLECAFRAQAVCSMPWNDETRRVRTTEHTFQIFKDLFGDEILAPSVSSDGARTSPTCPAGARGSALEEGRRTFVFYFDLLGEAIRKGRASPEQATEKLVRLEETFSTISWDILRFTTPMLLLAAAGVLVPGDAPPMTLREHILDDLELDADFDPSDSASAVEDDIQRELNIARGLHGHLAKPN